MLRLLDRLSPDKRVLIGTFLGLGLLIPSAGMRDLAFGRWLADPLPLLLSLGALLRGGFAQFNWVSPLIFLVYLSGASLLAGAVALKLGWHREGDAGVIARTAMLLNIGIIALLEIDAVMVGLWYLICLVVTLPLASNVANILSSYFRRLFRPDSL